MGNPLVPGGPGADGIGNIWIWSMVPLILKSGIPALTVTSLVLLVTSPRTLAADLGNPLTIPPPLLDQIIIKPSDIQWSRGTLWSDAAVVIPWLSNILDKLSDKYYALDHGRRYQCGWSLWRTQLLGARLARRLPNQRSSTMPRWNASIRVLPVSLKKKKVSYPHSKTNNLLGKSPGLGWDVLHLFPQTDSGLLSAISSAVHQMANGCSGKSHL